MLIPRFGTAVLLNATNYTLIDMSNIPAASVTLQCRTAVDVLLAISPTPVTNAYLTLKSGTSYSYDCNGLPLGAIRGADLVSNGGFVDGLTGWTCDLDDWTLDVGNHNVDKDANGITTLSQAACLATIGSTYEIVYTLSGWSVDTVTASFGGINGVARGANAEWKEYVKATGTTALTFTPTDTSRFTIDDIAVYPLTGNMLFAKSSSGAVYLEIAYVI